MRRVGVALALLAGCLAILVGLLVRRALESANFETTVVDGNLIALLPRSPNFENCFW